MSVRKMPARSVRDSWEPTRALDARAKQLVEQGMTYPEAYKRAAEEADRDAAKAYAMWGDRWRG